MRELNPNFWKTYLTEVLGIQQIISRETAEKVSDNEGFFWRLNAESQLQSEPPPLSGAPQRFLFLSCLKDPLEKSIYNLDSKDLLDKIQAALKWKDEDVLRIEFIGPQMTPVYHEMLNWHFAAVVLFSSEPDRQDVQTVKSVRWIETYSPQALLLNKELKKLAWEDLQKISKLQN